MFEIKVKYPGGSYLVHGERGGLARAGKLLREAVPGARRAYVVTDEHVRPLYLKPLAASLADGGFVVAAAAVPAGEEAKNVGQLGYLYREFMREGLTRADAVVALGGGSVSDLAGFAAATYKRGLPWAVVPTTLLAQLDASVGGKVAVDFEGVKNQVGTFHQPALVVADGELLATLPAKTLSAGMAEAVKYGLLIGGDFFSFLEANAGALLAARPALDEVVEKGLAYKAAVVAADERDQGERHLLNLGHTFGHAFESSSRFGLNHGEAVAVGLVYTCLLAELRGAMSTENVIRVANLLRTFNLPTYLPALPLERVLAALVADKKLDGDDVYMAIPHAPGTVIVEPVALRSLGQLLPQLHALARSMK